MKAQVEYFFCAKKGHFRVLERKEKTFKTLYILHKEGFSDVVPLEQ